MFYHPSLHHSKVTTKDDTSLFNLNDERLSFIREELRFFLITDQFSKPPEMKPRKRRKVNFSQFTHEGKCKFFKQKGESDISILDFRDYK